MYQLHGSLKAKENSGEKLIKILLEASKLISEINSCKLYVISKDNEQNNVVWVTEIWESKEDHDSSLKQDSIKALISQAIPILDGMPEQGQEFEIIGGYGI